MTLAIGAVIGQWLAFGGVESPARVYRAGIDAWQRQDYAEAARSWGRAASLQPDNPAFHYLLGSALARLGHRRAAADAYGVTLLLEPPEPLARLAQEGLERLSAVVVPSWPSETIVPLQSTRGVWITRVILNGSQQGRFLVDTGASLTIISPALAERAGIRTDSRSQTIALHTVAGLTAGSSATATSIRVGTTEVRDAEVVIHEPPSGVDGVLGNTVLSRYAMTIDVDRSLLRLTPSERR